jgi:hypothetical protein
MSDLLALRARSSVEAVVDSVEREEKVDSVAAVAASVEETEKEDSEVAAEASEVATSLDLSMDTILREEVVTEEVAKVVALPEALLLLSDSNVRLIPKFEC